ncbi:hypothetical protein M8494_26670 [Serratia ureilytica]
MERLNIFVAGRWREGRGEEMASVFPADGSVNARLRAANVEDVNEAVEAARRGARRNGAGWCRINAPRSSTASAT